MNYSVISASFLAQKEGEEFALALSIENEDGINMKHDLFLSEKVVKNAFVQRRLNMDDYTENDLLHIFENATLHGAIKVKKKGTTFRPTVEGQTVFDNKTGKRRGATSEDISGGKDFKVGFDGLWIDYEAMPFSIRFDRATIKSIERENLEHKLLLSKMSKSF